jgi:hypothetical protein
MPVTVLISIGLGAVGVIVFLIGLLKPLPISMPSDGEGCPPHPLEKLLAAMRRLAAAVRMLLLGDVSEGALDAFVIGAVFVFLSGIIIAIHFLWKYVGFIRDYWFTLLPVLLIPAVTQALIFRYIERPAHVPRRLGYVLGLALILNIVCIGIGAIPTLAILYGCAAILAVPFALSYGVVWALWKLAQSLNPTGQRGHLLMATGMVFLLAALGVGLVGAIG